MLLHLLAECIHDRPLHEIGENSAVSFVMKYCPIPSTFRNPASTQNLLNLSCCDSFSIRCLTVATEDLCEQGQNNPKELLS